ncbi:hypothetical protein ACFQZ4_13360 [Catellatospora coxensis]|uniref:Uncharacterized protein n=1 Tax=Catellatospora coxensis TaxID=310354 RepID=A0A8J3KZC0_9ACTN|nr:hypothetical protein [Catellatospora coxensis]GIG08249.1 hypothetical protein Cco03nite_49490 [Catellatospora coxensis]
MGVLVEHFAADADEIAAFDPASSPEESGLAMVFCKGWLHGLPWLAAELTGRDRSEFGEEKLVTALADGEVVVVAVPSEVTRALAGVTEERLAAYADDELLDEFETSWHTAIRDLARGAVATDRDLYCWMCV